MKKINVLARIENGIVLKKITADMIINKDNSVTAGNQPLTDAQGNQIFLGGNIIDLADFEAVKAAGLTVEKEKRPFQFNSHKECDYDYVVKDKTGKIVFRKEIR